MHGFLKGNPGKDLVTKQAFNYPKCDTCIQIK